MQRHDAGHAGRSGSGGSSCDCAAWAKFVCDNLQQEHRPCFDVVVVLDASADMAGNSWEEAMKCIQNIADEVLQADDGLGFVTFNQAVTTRRQLACRGSQPTNVKGLLRDVQPSGSAALWDGIFEGFKLLCKRTRQEVPTVSHPYLIVLTTGRDSGSRLITQEGLHEILCKPSAHGYDGNKAAHFHLFLFTFGQGANLDGVRNFCSRSHLRHYHKPNVDRVKRCFWNAQGDLRQVREAATNPRSLWNCLVCSVCTMVRSHCLGPCVGML